MSELSTFNVAMRVEAIKIVLANHPDLLKQVLNEKGDGIDLNSTPDEMDCYEPDDVLVRIAWDIWNGSGETEFDKVLELLPMEDFHAFIEAMEKFAELRKRIHHSYASGMEDD